MSCRFKVVIPARFDSSRLPGKPLLNIAGKPMIAHVCESARAAEADEIIVATDHQGIFNTVRELGFNAVMTRSDHQSGTERITEVAQLCNWQSDDIIVNLQGDEPLIPPAYIKAVALALAEQQQAGIATLAAPINEPEEIFNPNAVKVVLNKDGYALYFSRAPIPWERGAFGTAGGKPTGVLPYLRHIGLYAYQVNFLNRYCQWQASILETVEALEQLRILWYGEAIYVKTVSAPPAAGVDTEEDLLRVEKVLSLLAAKKS